MNFKDFYKIFYERYSGSKKLRKIWYHGTSSTFLNSILKNGLKSETKQKSWDSDPDANYNIPDRTSFGGIYFTENLGTAVSSAFRTCEKFGGDRIVVVTELQTKTLISDEDDFISFPNYDINTANYFYLGISKGFDSDSEEKEYYEYRDKWIKEKLNSIIMDYPDINDVLLKKIEELLKNTGWFSILQRAAAYFPEQSWKDIDNFKDYPDKQKAEKDYRTFIDLLTKLMKLYPRKTTGRQTSRILTDVGYKGSNKILAIIEFVFNGKDKDYKTEIILRYGSIPEEFKKDFKSHYNPDMKITDGRRNRL